MSKSISNSGEKTPTGVMTPSTEADSNLPNLRNLTICEHKEPETKDELLDRLAKLVDKLSDAITLREIQKSRPSIGSLSYPENVGMHVPSDISYSTPAVVGKPGIAVALKGFSTSARENQILFVSPANQNDSTFDMQLNSWHSTSMRSVQIDWLELLAEHTQDGLWQHGHWTSFIHAKSGNCNQVNAKIKFGKPYDEAPKVVVFLSGIQANCNYQLRFNIRAEDVTTTGFKLKGGTWCDSILFNLKITWISYASSLKGVHSGKVYTMSYRTHEHPQHLNMGYEAFPAGTFTKPPKVMVGFKHLDLACNREQNIKGFVSNVNQLGMCWNTDSWGETINLGAGLSYLAIEESD